MSEKTMMLVQATWQESQTFRMVPVDTTCPYVECIFDPGTKVFVIISKIKNSSIYIMIKEKAYMLKKSLKEKIFSTRSILKSKLISIYKLLKQKYKF